MKTLVVYYTKKGTTRDVAQRIADLLHADIFQIQVQDAKNGFISKLAARIWRALGQRPAIEPYDGSLTDYERVVLCTPIKHSHIPMPMCTFLTTYGKAINRVAYVFVKRVMSRDYPECITIMDDIIGKTFDSAIFVDASDDNHILSIEKFVDNMVAA